MALTQNEREVLDLEREWWRSGETKKAAIAARFGRSPAWYYAILNRAAGSPEGHAYDPLVARRVLRRIAARRRNRIAGEPASGGPQRRLPHR